MSAPDPTPPTGVPLSLEERLRNPGAEWESWGLEEPWVAARLATLHEAAAELARLRAEVARLTAERDGARALAEGRLRYASGFREKWLRAVDLVKRAFPLVSVAPVAHEGEDTGRDEWLRDARAALSPAPITEGADR